MTVRRNVKWNSRDLVRRYSVTISGYFRKSCYHRFPVRINSSNPIYLKATLTLSEYLESVRNCTYPLTK